MSMLDGVSQCWWLSETCAVNWDAWSAVGTVFAAVVALVLALVAYKQSESIGARKRTVAIDICRVLAARIFDEVNALAVNPGVIMGAWDERNVEFTQRSGNKLEQACRDVEGYLLDLPPKTSTMVAKVMTQARGLSEDVSGFEKHEMHIRIEIGDLITRDIYQNARGILDQEDSVMRSLGGKAIENRIWMDQRPRYPDQ